MQSSSMVLPSPRFLQAGSEKLSDLQLQLLEEEPGVSRQEVAAESEREPLPGAGDDEKRRKRRPHHPAWK